MGWEKDDEHIIGLSGNHSTMVKLSEDIHRDYEKIYEVLRKFSSAAPLVVASRLGRSLARSTHDAVPSSRSSAQPGQYAHRT